MEDRLDWGGIAVPDAFAGLKAEGLLSREDRLAFAPLHPGALAALTSLAFGFGLRLRLFLTPGLPGNPRLKLLDALLLGHATPAALGCGPAHAFPGFFKVLGSLLAAFLVALLAQPHGGLAHSVFSLAQRKGACAWTLAPLFSALWEGWERTGIEPDLVRRTSSAYDGSEVAASGGAGVNPPRRRWRLQWIQPRCHRGKLRRFRR
jgi:hypothetical protein